jgi:hypothetical protein
MKTSSNTAEMMLKLATLDIAGNSKNLLGRDEKIQTVPSIWSLSSKQCQQIVPEYNLWARRRSAFRHYKTLKATPGPRPGSRAELPLRSDDYKHSVETWQVICELFLGWVGREQHKNGTNVGNANFGSSVEPERKVVKVEMSPLLRQGEALRVISSFTLKCFFSA